MITDSQRRRHAVVQITPYYPPHLGGMENVAQCLAQLLSVRHDVEVLTTTCGSGDAPVRENNAGVRVRRFPGISVAHTPLSLGLVLRLLKVDRRSVVHVHIAQAFVPEAVLLTSALRRRPYIAHFHLDVDPSGPLGVLLNAYKRSILGPFLRRAAAVIALSDQQADFLESRYRIRRGRIAVIPNGVSPTFYRAATDSDRPNITKRVPRLLFVGRLNPQKNLPRLIDAMTHVSTDVELVIVGDGELRDDLARRIHRLGLTGVRLVGPARGDELVRWYRWADAFVLPSDKEGMPLVLLEAMAAGLAVIATDAPGTREVVDGVGLLTERNPESLGSAIERVAGDPDLLSSLSSRSAARGLHFRWDAAVTRLEHIYDSVAVK
jgi:glycosyltransferase involved in cell wall biosynthesis